MMEVNNPQDWISTEDLDRGTESNDLENEEPTPILVKNREIERTIPKSELEAKVKEEHDKQPLWPFIPLGTIKKEEEDIKPPRVKREDTKPLTSTKVTKPLSYPPMSQSSVFTTTPTLINPLEAIPEDVLKKHSTKAPTQEQVGCIIAKFQGLNLEGKPTYCESRVEDSHDDMEEEEEKEEAYEDACKFMDPSEYGEDTFLSSNWKKYSTQELIKSMKR
ncbi:unnamed protein product, partial [Rhizoctonia solani]